MVKTRKDIALSSVQHAIISGVNLRYVKRNVLTALKADCSDAELGKAIRLSVLEGAVLPVGDQ